MKWLFYKKESEIKAKVILEYNIEPSKKMLEKEHATVEKIIEPEKGKGKIPQLYCNPSTKELWYEYIDISKTKEELREEEIKKLKQQLEQCQQSITELTSLASTMLAPKM